jgi:chromosome partitioning protein
VKVIVFASSKGGVGKTTLAFNVAIHAAQAAAGVQFIDRDPQRSLHELCCRRRETPELMADNPQLLEGADTVASAVATLKDAGFARDYLVVDTPGSFMNIMGEAIAAADVVVIPLRPSPFDLVAIDAVVSTATKLGKTDRLLFVVNMADPRSDLAAETLKAVRGFSPNPPMQIANRIDYARAPITARAGIEINRDAAAEIAALWSAIVKVSKGPSHDKVQRKSRGPGAKVRAR